MVSVCYHIKICKIMKGEVTLKAIEKLMPHNIKRFSVKKIKLQYQNSAYIENYRSKLTFNQ